MSGRDLETRPLEPVAQVSLAVAADVADRSIEPAHQQRERRAEDGDGTARTNQAEELLQHGLIGFDVLEHIGEHRAIERREVHGISDVAVHRGDAIVDDRRIREHGTRPRRRFDRDHVGGGLEQRVRESAHPGTEFEHRAEGGRFHERANPLVVMRHVDVELFQGLLEREVGVFETRMSWAAPHRGPKLSAQPRKRLLNGAQRMT